MTFISSPQKTVVGDTSLYDNIWISTEHTAASEWKSTPFAFQTLPEQI